MQILKIPNEKDLYLAAFKLLNILGPVAGVLIIIGTVALGYVQTRPQDLPVTHLLTKGDRTFKLSVASTPEQLEKGGVGKSMFARGLAQIYIDNAVKFVGLDADNSNPHLIRFYEKAANIHRLDISNSDKLDEFVDNLKELVYPKSKESGKNKDEQSLILLETPSQFLPTLKILYRLNK
ncbi:hypothetical protein LC612_25580 [Nostoc sp. CHAB 5834]|nr:hypothetical protein [Nostoc sp. CHAB 5834]